MAGRANRARREAAAAERSAAERSAAERSAARSGTRTSPAGEKAAAVPPGSTACVRSPATDQSPSGFSFGAALGVRRDQDALRAAAAAGGQRATDPSSSNVTAGLSWVQRPSSMSSSSEVSSEGQQSGQNGVSDIDSSGAGPGSSSASSSSDASSGGTDSFAQPAVLLPPSDPLAAVQATQVSSLVCARVCSSSSSHAVHFSTFQRCQIMPGDMVHILASPCYG
jgi:trimeric autotransporter adhesin